MTTIDMCEYCKNCTGLKDGWLVCCTAFPEGIPPRFHGSETECNNGIKFERDSEKAEIFGFKILE